MALLAWATAGCTGISGGGQDAGPGTPDSGPAAGVSFSFTEAENIGPDDPSRGGGLGLALSSTGEVAVLYFLDLTSTQTCTTNVDTKQVAENELKLALAPDADTGFTVTSVTRTRSADGVAAAYTTGGLVALFPGGANGSGACSASDLMVATFAGTTPNITTLAADGNTSAMCQVIQNACNRGDNIGRFPSVAFGPTGTRYVAAQDTHFGFGTQVDFEGSDLEVFTDGAITTVDDSSGAANFNVMMVAEGDRPAVAHVQIKSHTFTSGNKPEGIWLSRQKADMTWENIHVNATIPTNQIGAAWHPVQGYAIAWQDPGEKDLLVATSVNGTTWTVDNVDVLGDTGATPAVAFSQNTLVIAYAACNGPNDASGMCQPARDGVRLAWKDGATWRKSTVWNTEEFLEGTDIRMVMTPNGDPIIAFKSQGTSRVMVSRGRRR